MDRGRNGYAARGRKATRRKNPARHSGQGAIRVSLCPPPIVLFSLAPFSGRGSGRPGGYEADAGERVGIDGRAVCDIAARSARDPFGARFRGAEGAARSTRKGETNCGGLCVLKNTRKHEKFPLKLWDKRNFSSVRRFPL